MTYEEFLIAKTSGKDGAPVYKEALIWLKEGWTFERVVAEWQRGDDLLWLLEGVGAITKDEAMKLACTCVDRCGVLAPDVLEISDAVKRGDMTAAAFGAACIRGNAEGKETETVKEGKEPILPAAELKSYPGAEKARYVATLLLDDSRPYMALSHSVQAKVHNARDAWAQALKDGNKVEIAELAAAIPRIEAAEHKAHADIVRAYFGGLK